MSALHRSDEAPGKPAYIHEPESSVEQYMMRHHMSYGQYDMPIIQSPSRSYVEPEDGSYSNPLKARVDIAHGTYTGAFRNAGSERP